MQKALRIVLSWLVVVSMFSLISCRESSDSEHISIADVKSAVFESDFDEMVELGKNQLANYYSYEEEWFTEFSVYIADSESRCDEVAIFRLADNKYLKSAVASIEQRINSQSAATNAQNSSEFLKLSRRVLLQKDDVIVMVVSEQGEEIAKRLREKFGFKDIKI